jgi:hypothetical protein
MNTQCLVKHFVLLWQVSGDKSRVDFVLNRQNGSKVFLSGLMLAQGQD